MSSLSSVESLFRRLFIAGSLYRWYSIFQYARVALFARYNFFPRRCFSFRNCSSDGLTAVSLFFFHLFSLLPLCRRAFFVNFPSPSAGEIFSLTSILLDTVLRLIDATRLCLSPSCFFNIRNTQGRVRCCVDRIPSRVLADVKLFPRRNFITIEYIA